MIQMVFYDMLPFFTVLIISILSIATVEVQASKVSGTNEDFSFDSSLQYFWFKAHGVYEVGYGNWGDFDKLELT